MQYRTPPCANHPAVLSVLLLATASTQMPPANAGGLDRSGQSITSLFEQGRVFQFYHASVSPDVEGKDSLDQSTGDVVNQHSMFGIAYKTGIAQSQSFALIVDQPWAADFAYAATSPLYGSTQAVAKSLSVSALLEQRLPSGLSFFGGPRLQEFSGRLALNGFAFGPLAGYTMDSKKDLRLGYVTGVAYERSEYGQHLSLSYSSSIKHQLKTNENISPVATSTKVTTPQSVNLAFRTGIANNTLLLASVRWVNWQNFEFSPETLGFTLATFDEDIFTYTLGAAYRFSPKFSGSITLRHEEKADTANSIFRPSNGYTGIVLSGTYTAKSQLATTVGLSYTQLGDAAAVTAGGNNVAFRGSDSLAVGIRISAPF